MKWHHFHCRAAGTIQNFVRGHCAGIHISLHLFLHVLCREIGSAKCVRMSISAGEALAIAVGHQSPEGQ